MSYDDDKLGKLFPTRSGGVTGSSNERQMLDKTGADGFRKSYRTLADGSVVRCETRNGFATFILERIESAVEAISDIGMDSGVVDLIKALPNWSGIQDDNIADGKLYATTFVSNYFVSAQVNADSPIVNIITPPHTAGTPESNGSIAKSFRKKKAADYTALYARKRTAVLCPPSMFTGKTRLYVQALYGRHDALDNVSATSATTELLARPSIYVSGAEIHTSCGVFLDAATGVHYLISVEGAQSKIYRMAATAAAEKLRPKLIDAAIPVAEREKIESFVLAYSNPKTLISTLDNGVGYAESMGYGWHFNWSGTACDIVINEVVNAPSGGTENESTHYRLNFSSANGVFSVSHSVVDGPVRWKGRRHDDPITSPLWYRMSGLEKFGAHYGPDPYGDAPIYVFYKRDEIQVCRYSSTTGAISRGATRSPPYVNPGNFYTQGSDALDYRSWNDWSGVTTSLSCGSTTIAYARGTRSSTVKRATSPVMEMPSLAAMDWTRGDTAIHAGNQVFQYGKSSPISLTSIGNYYEGLISVYGGTNLQSGGGTYPQLTYNVPASPALTTFASTGFVPATWQTFIGTESNSYSSHFIFVIPFYDAEAVVMLGAQTTRRYESGTKTEKKGGGFFKAIAIGQLFGAYPSELISTYELMSSSDLGESISSESYQETDSSSQNTILFVGSSTSCLATIPTPGAFFSETNDVVPVLIKSNSSCNGASFSNECGVNQGLPSVSLTDNPVTFVGYA